MLPRPRSRCRGGRDGCEARNALNCNVRSHLVPSPQLPTPLVVGVATPTLLQPLSQPGVGCQA